MRCSTSISAGSFLAVSLLCSNLLAHVQFSYPTPRRPGAGNDDIKTGPCGCSEQACPNGDVRKPDRVTELTAGETITVEFTETIQHPGFFRISFDDNGQDAFVPPPLSRTDIQMGATTLPVLKDNIPDTGDSDYAVEIVVPNISCDNCTLQLIQVMTNEQTWEDEDIYFTCADIRIVGGNAGAGGMGSGGMSAGGMSSGGMSAGGMSSGGAGAGGAGAGGMSAGGTAGTAGTLGAGGAGTGGMATGGAGAGAGNGPTGGAGMASGAVGGTAAGTAGTGPTAGTAGASGAPMMGQAGMAGHSGPVEFQDRVVTGEEGCTCSTARRRTSPGWLLLGAGALAAAFGRRRRRTA
jgi:MYXO-CTERM domain-containing protein